MMSDNLQLVGLLSRLCKNVPYSRLKEGEHLRPHQLLLIYVCDRKELQVNTEGMMVVIS